MIKLGENIDLEGFESVDRANYVVLRKIIGNQVKKLQENPSFRRIKLALNQNDGSFEISANLELEGKTVQSDSKNTNLFFGLNHVFESLSKQL